MKINILRVYKNHFKKETEKIDREETRKFRKELFNYAYAVLSQELYIQRNYFNNETMERLHTELIEIISLLLANRYSRAIIACELTKLASQI